MNRILCLGEDFDNMPWEFTLIQVSIVLHAGGVLRIALSLISPPLPMHTHTRNFFCEIILFLARWENDAETIKTMISLQCDTYFNLLMKLLLWTVNKCRIVCSLDTQVKYMYPLLNSPWFLSLFFQARKLISDFAIILSILIFCVIDALVGVDTPKLIVPSEFKVGELPSFGLPATL